MDKQFLLRASCVWGAFSPFHCFAQKVPVSVVESTGVNEGTRLDYGFGRSLSDEIQLSATFYQWPGRVSGLPSNGVLIHVTSINVRLQNGQDLGSVISRTRRPSKRQ